TSAPPALVGIGRVEREGALGLGLVDVGAGLEAVHLTGIVAELGGSGLSLRVRGGPCTPGKRAQRQSAGSDQLHLIPPMQPLASVTADARRFNRRVPLGRRRTPR